MIQWLFITLDKGWRSRWFSKAGDHFQNTWLPGLDDESSCCPRAALFSWAHDSKEAVCVTRWAFPPNQPPFLFVFFLQWIKLIGSFYGFSPFKHLKLHNYSNVLCSYNGCVEYICPILCFSNTISASFQY